MLNEILYISLYIYSFLKLTEKVEWETDNEIFRGSSHLAISMPIGLGIKCGEEI